MATRAVDPCTDYADDVLCGNIIAGKPVVAACKRHMQDLERDDIFYDLDEADYIFDFYEEALSLSVGKWEGKPFLLFPWEYFVVGSLFGYQNADTGFRRFRFAYIETAKGSGKSPVVAGMGLFGLVADEEPGAQIYFLATTAEQAMSSFRPACNMVEANPDLSELIIPTGGKNPWNLSNARGDAYMRRISAVSAFGKSGPISHYVICDEYHEHKNSDLLDICVAGAKHREQPLTVIITNAGILGDTPCQREHMRALRVVNGDIENDEYFGYVCMLDEGDSIHTEEVWIKANPSLPQLPTVRYLRSELLRTDGLPASRSQVERLNFCMWTDSTSPWLTRERWQALEVDKIEEDVLADCPCYLAIDLSLKSDLTAGAGVWDLGAGEFAGRTVCWHPEDNLKQHEAEHALPYSQWVDDGYLKICKGSTIKYADVVVWIAGMLAKYNVLGLASDSYKVDLLKEELDEAGIECTTEKGNPGLLLVNHGQSFVAGARKVETRKDDEVPLWMSRSIDQLEELILEERMMIEYSAPLRSAALGAVIVYDASENRKMHKRKSTAKVDPIMALTFATGLAHAGLLDDGGLEAMVKAYIEDDQWQDYEQ